MNRPVVPGGSTISPAVRFSREPDSEPLPHLRELAIGGTAVGTGLNTPPDFGMRVAAELERATGLGFVTAPNRFVTRAAHAATVHAHGALTEFAAAAMKIANDVPWLA